jgi:hypothetical protein
MKHKPHEDGWVSLLAQVSEAIDLESSVRSSGALVRKRQFREASALLRVALAYGPGGLSLRETAAWACAQGVADISDVALMYRLRDCADWLGEIAGRLLARRAPLESGLGMGHSLRLMDATVISAPGAATNWRLHAVYDVAAERFDHLDLTDIHGAEKLERAPLVGGEIRIADRCYARPEGLAHLIDAQGDYVVRVGSRSLRLANKDGTPLDLSAVLKQSARSKESDQPVLILHGRKRRWKPRPARLIVIRKPPEAAQRSRQKSRHDSRRGQHRYNALTHAAAGHLILVTSLARSRYPAAKVAGLYRMRWQIELAFKRLKSLLRLDDMAAKDPDLVRAWVFAHLIVALLIEDLNPEIRDSPPSASHSDTASPLPVAAHQNTVR